MRRSLLVSLLFIVFVAIGSFAATQAAGWSPALGLDLQGGASVVLEPNRDVPSRILDQSIEIIRSRVDALGVAEPEISRQGDAIVVELPGVRNQDEALRIVGQTAELRFRPVLGPVPPEGQTTTTTTSTTVAGAETTTTVAGETTTTTAAPESIPTTKRDDDVPEREVVLPVKGSRDRLRLGPAGLTGRAVKSAQAAFENQWVVNITFTNKGSDQFDQLAAQNFQKQLAIVLDGVVQSAPTIQQQQFNGQAQISGDFTEKEAKELALVLRYGALPVQLEPQTVQKVSATLGKDSLRAGLLAGAVGLGLVLIYMILYYRALGVVVLLGLGVSAALMYAIVSTLSRTSGLALSLAGATGIIVSVGVTVDSYVVYFERLKDEIRSGKTVRSSVDRGFSLAFRTIRAADIASLIGAGLLYFLTVGPVRGFAFFLGLSTLLDLVVAYFFTRPLVAILARNRVFTEARWLGVARGLAAAPTGGAA